MAETPAPDAAAAIVRELADVIRVHGYESAASDIRDSITEGAAPALVVDLRRRGVLHDPSEIQRLRAVARWAHRLRDQWPADWRPDATVITLFCALDATSVETAVAGGDGWSLEEREQQIRALLDQYNRLHREETGCTCRSILPGMTAHGCPTHDRHDEDE